MMNGRTAASVAACVLLMLGCGTSVPPPAGAAGAPVAPATRTAPEVVAFDQPPAVPFFPGSDPIGKTFRTVKEPDYPEAEYEVVGLVKNTRYFALQAAQPPMAYLPGSQFPLGVVGNMIFIRSQAPLPRVEAAIRHRIASWRPGTGMRFCPPACSFRGVDAQRNAVSAARKGQPGTTGSIR